MEVWDRVQQRIEKGQYSCVTSSLLPAIIYISLLPTITCISRLDLLFGPARTEKAPVIKLEVGDQ